jgi:hypothetical protein
MMKKASALAAICGAALIAWLQPAAARQSDVICTDAFSGTARNVTVPSDNFCDLSGARITGNVVIDERSGVFAEGLTVGHDVILQGEGDLEIGAATIAHDVIAKFAAGMHLERTTIQHDLRASQPQTVQTGHNAPDSPGGPVRVGHDVEISGSPADFEFVFDGICDVTVGHDFRVTDRSVTLGFAIGDNCGSGNTVGHDLIVTGNSALAGFFGPSALQVGNNHVGHDLVFSRNTAVPGGFLEVNDNVAGHDAICADNDPAATTAPGGPNSAGHANTCG